ncbi:hypothetical protein Mal48_38490 [Thalassoglobus polymorphus]|uniref:Uncharacterized protein n=1 Tax=Thalassoglobus polymorphus TaxID=2527994 RepID=A0A517QSH7_9PLAN|nr:hypothetical protein Mal48_38490 [Thalassoglobus polymorphus]
MGLTVRVRVRYAPVKVRCCTNQMAALNIVGDAFYSTACQAAFEIFS